MFNRNQTMSLQSISDAQKLPFQVVDLQTVKIGDQVYKLDRAITFPHGMTAGNKNLVVGRPTKMAKIEEQGYYLEIKWEKYDDESTPNKTYEYSMFADEIPEEAEGGFALSRAFVDESRKNDAGENHEYYFTLCLVDSKSKDRKTLVEMNVLYWKSPINLMHFHQLSQDLANFCCDLWKAAGRDANDYNDMAIEFGESPYSLVEIGDLVEEATGLFNDHVMYISSAKLDQDASSQDVKKFLRMIYSTFPVTVISFEVDLNSLGIEKSECEDFGFHQLRYYNCFVGMSDEI